MVFPCAGEPISQPRGDRALLRELYPTLRGIIDWHRRGTRYAIHVDPEDGLLYAGEPGVQLTWMDAKVGDWVVTPRIGKPVEDQRAVALRALQHGEMGAHAARLRPPRSITSGRAPRRRGLRGAFWFEEGGYLYDVLDGPEGTSDARGRRVDASLRPNQIFAVSLGTDLLDARPCARGGGHAARRSCLTPVGLRSLSPRDPRYAAHYSGGPRERDGAYHQGTVWSWLLGPFALAHYRVYRDRRARTARCSQVSRHIWTRPASAAISEIMDGDAPHAPRGCFAQAWSVIGDAARLARPAARSRRIRPSTETAAEA